MQPLAPMLFQGSAALLAASMEAASARHATHESGPNAKFARAHAPCFISKRKICTCTLATDHFHTQNLHVHGS